MISAALSRSARLARDRAPESRAESPAESRAAALARIERTLGAGPLPSLAGQFAGPVLIMGGAACVRDDLARIDGGWRGARLAVNDIGAHYRGALDHWVTLHPAYLAGWQAYRMGHNFGDRGHVFTHSDRADAAVQCAWPVGNRGGSSGLFACFVALLLGYERIVLAGVPCDDQPHYFDPLPAYRGALGNPAVSRAWRWARDHVFAGRVTSLSGRTRHWLGAPPLASP